MRPRWLSGHIWNHNYRRERNYEHNVRTCKSLLPLLLTSVFEEIDQQFVFSEVAIEHAEFL